MNNSSARRAKSILSSTAVLAAAAGLSGCINIGSSFDGVPVTELDMSGDAPTEISLAGPDDLFLTVGDKLVIQIEGDDDVVKDLRFRIDGDMLKIGRESGWDSARGTAIVRVTMPAPEKVSLAGSGDLQAETLASSADVDLAGSGAMDIGTVASDDLEIDIAGAGKLTGKGTAKTLEISIAGSGDVDFADLKADDVEISIAGSGDINLASDGSVNASIAGSGDVVVTGKATCTSSAAGSGNVTCREAPATAEAKSEDDEAAKPSE
jgi:carbon monoxide dehydrogenase subunit G